MGGLVTGQVFKNKTLKEIEYLLDNLENCGRTGLVTVNKNGFFDLEIIESECEWENDDQGSGEDCSDTKGNQ
jgi:hypothetical protein